MKIIIETFEEKSEVAPGFLETRRRMLWLPASIVASIAFDRAGIACAGQSVQEKSPSETSPRAHGQLDWAAFLKECVPVAEELHKDSSAPGQEAYPPWIAWMIVRARASDIPRAKVGRFGKRKLTVRFGVGYSGPPVFYW